MIRPILCTLLALRLLTAGAEEAAPRRSTPPLPPILFGPEFTFALPHNSYFIEDGFERPLIERMQRHLIDGQPDGIKFQFITPDTFVSPNGWSFSVSIDPGVIEIGMKPMDVDTAKRYARDIQDAIFESAYNEKLFPALFTGGGHINIDLNILARRPLLLRNFIVDLFNHGELFMGVLSYDTNNALPFALFNEETREAIQTAIDTFDGGGSGHILNLLRRLNEIQAHSQDRFLAIWQGPVGKSVRYKHTAVSFVHADKEGIGPQSRLEIRGVRPQANFHVWVKQIELLRGRLEYLNRLKTPIPFRPAVRLVSPIYYSMKGHGLNPPVEPQEALAAFHRYVIESGQSWDDYRDNLWPAWIASGEVERYEHSADFKAVKRLACQQALGVGP